MSQALGCLCCGEMTTNDAHSLCYVCANELTLCFNDNAANIENKHHIIDNPSFAYHCVICGEYESREIADELMPICDKCVADEMYKYEQECI